MQDKDLILKDAIRRLSDLEKLDNVNVKHVEDRPFSVIYELSDKSQKYILKISTTSRSCKKEYKMYQLLMKKKINCIIPITYSAKYNYIITKKQELDDFESILKNKKKVSLYLELIGKTLKRLEIRKAKFDKTKYLDYVLSRLDKTTSFSKKQRTLIRMKIQGLCEKMDNQLITNSLVSDFSFSNLFFNKNNELVLVDMGDAEIEDVYQNITTIYLNLKFGVLSKYHEKKKRTRKLFNIFLRSYGLESVNKVEFRLYQCKHLLNMMLFTSNQKKNPKNILEKIQLNYYINRYKRHLVNILGV